MPTVTDVPVPKQRSYPLIGHSIELLRRPLEFVTSLRDLGDIVRIQLPSTAYVVNSPALIRQLLVTDSRKVTKGVQFQKLRATLGNGLVTSEGTTHRRNRRLAQPAFHRKRISDYVDIMSDCTEKMIADWKPGQQLLLDQELSGLAMTIVAKAL
ncbi:MAG: cytochrome P450, partial [Corynebacteriales bacterium]|nr:cytochrome P450 [Mycobacteriales bacterium]